MMSVVVKLALPDCRSAREKQALGERMVGRLREGFNAGVAVVGPAEPPGELVLAAVAVARQPREARDTLERILAALEAHPGAELAAPPAWGTYRPRA
jgi:uncharacterized protein YlxP (DUF503 family)